MLLTFEDIRKIAFGSVKTEQKLEGFVFRKCTEKQTEAWHALSRDLGDRSLTTTGIRLDFHTDSRTFAFDAVRGGKFDVLTDGLITGHFKPTADSRRYECALPEGDTRVTLVFPSHSVGVIDRVTLDDGAYVRPHVFDTRILFYGDSITQGWNTEYDSLSFAWRTAMHYNADCVINGIGGAVFYPAGTDEIPFQPDTVIVALGTNDYGRYKSAGQLRAAADGTLSALARMYGGSRLVALTPIWRGDDDQPKAMGPFTLCRETVAASAAANGFEIIEGYDLVPHFPDLFADGWLHPNDLGMGLYADNLIRALDRK